jgi:hypothetical protein
MPSINNFQKFNKMKVKFRITYVSIDFAIATKLKIGDVCFGILNELRNRISYLEDGFNCTFYPGETCEIIES